MAEFFLDRETRDKLEWDYFLSLLEVRSPLGLEFKNRLTPFLPEQLEQLKKELKRCSAFTIFLSRNPHWAQEFATNLSEIKDLKNSLKKAQKEGTLNQTELFDIKRVLLTLHNLRDLLDYRGLSFLSQFKPRGSRQLLRTLSKGKQGLHSFYLVDDYSSNLRRIRRKKRELQARLSKETSSFKKGNTEASHEQSVLLEKPFSSVLKLKEEIKSLEIEEAVEERKVCQRLSRKVSMVSESLKRDLEKVGYLDFLFAKCEVAQNFGSTIPQILSPKARVSVKIEDGLFLPLAHRLKEKGERFQPLSITLRDGATLVTGANMSGKTVLLKTVGLNVCLAQHGMLVPAKSFKFKPFEFLFFSTRGKEPDGLSAFGAEISGLKKALSLREKRGLYLIDELARGTNPKEGFAINASILKILSQTDSTSVFTSHFDGLDRVCKVDHWEMSGLGDISLHQVKLILKKGGEDLISHLMEFRPKKVKGEKPVPHDALKIALLLGLEEDVIELAQTFLKKV
ncbi:MAG: hypothetical protein NUV68_05380 [Caldiserica bacterium]|jgi:dsDNA-specific endonuclease/ATPase MutS2|nr:hypothetical protein [Caldisericota bacterium]MDH7562759.1 hypothetical protein [Caldisericota bacterium]